MREVELRVAAAAARAQVTLRAYSPPRPPSAHFSSRRRRETAVLPSAFVADR
ncbi:hypothetical protein EJB05_27122, partial [Eragrostis curvula]